MRVIRPSLIPLSLLCIKSCVNTMWSRHNQNFSGRGKILLNFFCPVYRLKSTENWIKLSRRTKDNVNTFRGKILWPNADVWKRNKKTVLINKRHEVPFFLSKCKFFVCVCVLKAARNLILTQGYHKMVVFYCSNFYNFIPIINSRFGSIKYIWYV